MAILLIAGAGAAVGAPQGGIEEVRVRAWQKDLQVLQVMTLIGSATSSAPPALRGEVQALMTGADEARRRGDLGGMRRKLSHASAVLAGDSWDEAAEFSASLVLRSSEMVHDPSGLLVATLSQQFPTAYRLSAQVEARVTLVRGSAHGRSAARARQMDVVRDFGTFQVLSRDLIDTPFSMTADLSGVPDGDYRLRTVLSGAERKLAVAETNVHVVSGLVAARREVEARLAAIEDHGSTRASIRYPFDYARTLNEGVRQPLRYDFRSGVEQAFRLLEALERGEDPLWRTTGGLERHYYLDLAGRYEPYRIYVPESWDGQTKLPLVVALHGSFGDHNSFFEMGDVAKSLADRYEWAMVAPAGYAHNSVFGSRRRVVLANGTSPPARALSIDGVVLSAEDYQPSPAEQDVLTVVELMKREYRIDEERVYLTGSSMGGEGVWHLGAKYPHLWAALAPVAAALHPDDLDERRLRDVPVLAVHGDADPITSWEASRDAVDRLNAAGGNAEMLRLEGRGHRVWAESLDEIFAFFELHSKLENR